MITLWGPTSAGKTALLSLLYLRAKSEPRDWYIFPTSLSVEMVVNQTQRIEIENEFPKGTIEGSEDERQLSYKFQHKTTGEEFLLETADMAGSRSSTWDPELIASLKAAQGIILFLDRSRDHPDSEVKMALAKMYGSRADENNKPDARPLAVCLVQGGSTDRETGRLQARERGAGAVCPRTTRRRAAWLDQPVSLQREVFPGFVGWHQAELWDG